MNNFNNPNAWNFAQWDTWAKTVSPNPNVKIYIGVPAATSAANAGSYVDVGTLTNIIQQTRSQYSSFGGVMMWDASQAYREFVAYSGRSNLTLVLENNRFDAAIKSVLTNGGGSVPTAPTTSAPASTTSKPTTTSAPTSTTTTTTAAPTTTAPSSGSCAVAAWQANVAVSHIVLVSLIRSE